MRIKFICLNLWLGGLLFDRILEFLRQEKPDILVVQEVYNSHNPQFTKRLHSVNIIKATHGFPFVFFAPACIVNLRQGEVEAGNAIFSRLPIIKTKTTFFDIPFKEVSNYEEPGGDYSLTPRNLQQAVIRTNNTELNIFNTQGIWGKDSEDSARRLKMSNTIVRQIKNKHNIILAGDFNLMPHTQSVLNIERYLDNLFKGRIKTTFNMKQKTNPVLARVVVDMVFASRELKIVECYMPDADISDHMPLVCVFEV